MNRFKINSFTNNINKNHLYNESLLDKQVKKEIYKRLISSLLACQIFLCGITINNSVKYKIDKDNPFDEEDIVSSDFVTNYKIIKSERFLTKESLKDIISSLKNSDIDDKKVYLLYYSILSNESLNDRDKQKLGCLIQYFLDNKYLDKEYVYNKLNSVIKKENDPNMVGKLGFYRVNDNSITIKSDSYYDCAFSHEILHSEDKSIDSLNYSNYSWLLEGMTTILDYEYFDKDISYTYTLQTAFVRILCEIVGSDILFETRATGNINTLVKALIDKGLDKAEIYDLFENVENAKTDDKEEQLNLKIEIIDSLRNWYLKIHKDCDYANYAYYRNILQIYNGNNNPKYYFNSTKKSLNSKNLKEDFPIDEFNISINHFMEDLLVKNKESKNKRIKTLHF